MTGNKCLLDTSIIIHAFKNVVIGKHLEEFSEIFIPSIVIGELYYGAYRSQNVKRHLDEVNEFIGNCKILNSDIVTSDFDGRIKTSLKARANQSLKMTFG